MWEKLTQTCNIQLELVFLWCAKKQKKKMQPTIINTTLGLNICHGLVITLPTLS